MLHPTVESYDNLDEGFPRRLRYYVDKANSDKFCNLMMELNSILPI